jgi:hypothetical protein
LKEGRDLRSKISCTGVLSWAFHVFDGVRWLVSLHQKLVGRPLQLLHHLSPRDIQREARESQRDFLGARKKEIVTLTSDTAGEREEEKEERKKQDRDRKSFLGATERQTLPAVTQQMIEIENWVAYNWEECRYQTLPLTAYETTVVVKVAY